MNNNFFQCKKYNDETNVGIILYLANNFFSRLIYI